MCKETHVLRDSKRVVTVFVFLVDNGKTDLLENQQQMIIR